MPSKTVKLVIWDLDETLWSGTLSEGGISPVPGNAEIIAELTRRGIVSSVCSKNDHAAAATELKAIGVWPFIVFPRIAWTPKGELVRQIIEDAQLRAPDVLFIDDNPQNLAEAAFACPGLQTMGPEAIPGLPDSPGCKGKPDPEMKRLAQYKVLEAKAADRAASAGSNEDFLRQAGIIVRVQTEGLESELDRIHDLVLRSNQLNYTKVRAGREELAALISDPNISAGCVHVRDRYGDYGIVGFYAIRSGQAEHFTFSCRTLNMGVEQWIYHAKLGAPRLEIVGRVVSSLGERAPDWIKEASPIGDVVKVAASRRRVLLVGGCDLAQVRDFLGGETAFDAEFNFVGPTGMPIHREHTEILKRSNDPMVRAEFGDIIDRLPFLTRDAYKSDMLCGRHHAYVYSVLMDYTQGLYRYRDTSFIVPYGDFTIDITQPRTWDGEILNYGVNGMDAEFLSWFRENFTFLGGLSEADFANNLSWLRSRMSGALHIMNGAEVNWPGEPGRAKRHAQMNAVLESFAGSAEGVEILDIRQIVNSRDDISDSIRHYTRRAYYDIANVVRPILYDQAEGPLDRFRRWLSGTSLHLGRKVVSALPVPISQPVRSAARRVLGRA